MKVRLDARLQTVANLVRPGASVADIGSDHALIPCYLRQCGHNRDIIASDMNPGPLECARRNIERFGCEGIKLLLSNGFENFPPDMAIDDVIIAGMGGELIAQILKGCTYTHESMRFILQPMTKQEHLRRELALQGFEILAEYPASWAKKNYIIIHAYKAKLKSS